MKKLTALILFVYLLVNLLIFIPNSDADHIIWTWTEYYFVWNADGSYDNYYTLSGQEGEGEPTEHWVIVYFVFFHEDLTADIVYIASYREDVEDDDD